MLTRLACLTALCLSILVFGANAQSSCSYSDEEQLASRVKDLFSRGEASMTDVVWADLNLLEAKYQCRAARIGYYCTTAQDLVKKLKAGVEEEVRIGQRSTKDLIAVQAESRRIQAACRSDWE